MYSKVFENFSDLENAFMTKSAVNTINDFVSKQTNSQCILKTQEGEIYDFQSNGTYMNWYQVPNQENKCAIEIGGVDINNNVKNCSKENTILYDPNIVEDLTLTDALTGAKRCNITFKKNLPKSILESYVRKQTSYQKNAECDQTLKDVMTLREERRVLLIEISEARQQEQDALSKKDIARQNREKAELRKSKADKNVVAAGMELQTANTNLGNAKKTIERMKENVFMLQRQLNSNINAWEKQLAESQLTAYNQKMKELAYIEHELTANARNANEIQSLNVGISTQETANIVRQKQLETEYEKQAMLAKQKADEKQKQVDAKQREIDAYEMQMKNAKQKEIDAYERQTTSIKNAVKTVQNNFSYQGRGIGDEGGLVWTKGCNRPWNAKYKIGCTVNNQMIWGEDLGPVSHYNWQGPKIRISPNGQTECASLGGLISVQRDRGSGYQDITSQIRNFNNNGPYDRKDAIFYDGYGLDC